MAPNKIFSYIIIYLILINANNYIYSLRTTQNYILIKEYTDNKLTYLKKYTSMSDKNCSSGQQT